MSELTMDDYQAAVHKHGAHAHGWLRLKGYSMTDVLHAWREAQRLGLYVPGSIA